MEAQVLWISIETPWYYWWRNMPCTIVYGNSHDCWSETHSFHRNSLSLYNLLLGTHSKKNYGIIWEFFPSGGPPPPPPHPTPPHPPPLLGSPYSKKKIIVYFAF